VIVGGDKCDSVCMSGMCFPPKTCPLPCIKLILTSGALLHV
jgi:hypothetical protein